MKRFSKFIAFFLLLVFLQKSCLNLWMHNWFHTQKATAAAKSGEKGFHAMYTSACNCIDEFTTPFIHAEIPALVFASSDFSLYALPTYHYLFSLQVSALSLTAPPSLA